MTPPAGLRWFAQACLLATAIVWASGCDGSGSTGPRVSEVQQLQDKIELQARMLVEKDEHLRAAQAEIQQLRGLEGDRTLDRLVHVDAIEIERMSGGYDDDRDSVDDGIVVYLVLLDQDRDTIKAAGNVDIQLLDLAQPQGQQLVGHVSLDADALRPCWYGRFLNAHYSVKVPWPDGAKSPPHKSITILVQFTDLLSGKAFTTQKVVDVALAS